MRNTFALAFYCRKSRMDKKGLAPVELAVGMNTSRSFINLPVKMAPDIFEKQLAAKKGNNLKAYIATIEGKIRDLKMDYSAIGKALTMEDVREYVKSGFYRSYTLEDLWTDFYESFKKFFEIYKRIVTIPLSSMVFQRKSVFLFLLIPFLPRA